MSKRKGDPGYAPGWCIHYRAQDHKDCEAGVPFSKWDGTKFDTRPCFLTKTGESKPGAAPCEHLRRPTPEEIAAHEAWSDARWEKMKTVLSAVSDWRAEHKKARRGANKTMDCPACKGTLTLHLSISGYNVHVHGHCDTEGCVSWME